MELENLEFDEDFAHDAVEMVHHHLEALKYISQSYAEGCDGKFPNAGEGVDIRILLLPHLLLSFRRTNALKRSYVVGGRSTMVYCALLDLLTDEDGLFRVHLLAKTGQLGVRLLEDHFRKTKRERLFRSDALPYLEALLRDGKPRCTFLDLEVNRKIEWEPIQKHDDILIQDLDSAPELAGLVKMARTIGFFSIQNPASLRLLKWILSQKEGASKCKASQRSTPQGQEFKGRARCDGIFLDTENAPPGSIRDLACLLKNLPSQSASLIQGIFLQNNVFAGNRQNGALTVAGICKNLKVIGPNKTPPLIIARRNKTEFMWEKSDFVIKRGVDFKAVDELERFKAGVLLASSVQRTVYMLANASPSNRASSIAKAMKEEWSAGGNHSLAMKEEWSAGRNDWLRIIYDGLSLAKLKSTDDPPDRSLLQALVKEYRSSNHLRDVPAVNSAELGAEGGGPARLPVTMIDVARFSRLAGSRRLGLRGKPGEIPLCQDGFHCPLERTSGAEPRSDGKDSCWQRRNGKNGPARAAVMIDLDGTLLDSTTQRNIGLAAAFRELLVTSGTSQKSTGEGRERKRVEYKLEMKPVDFFQKYVYEPWQVFKTLGYGNFRQQWNLEGWYVAFLVLANNQSTRDSITLGNGVLAQEAEKAKSPEALLSKYPWMERFRDEYAKAADDYRSAIAAARAAFHQARKRPFKEARDFLVSLRNSGSFDLYIVSEGDPDTQGEKIQAVGLDDCFERGRVLTTGDTAEPVKERDHLRKEVQLLESERDRLKREIDSDNASLELARRIAASFTAGNKGSSPRTLPPPAKEGFDKVEKQISENWGKWQTVVEQIETAECVRRVLDRFGYKLGMSFYPAVIRAIQKDPASPLGELKDFEEIGRRDASPGRRKFAMVGDRQTRDIGPVNRLFHLGHDPTKLKRALTIRLRSGSYANDPKEEPRPDNLDAPMFEADTLAQVKALLLNPSAWKNVCCLCEAPPLYNWRVGVLATQRDKMPENPEKEEEIIGLDHLTRGMAMPPDHYPVINKICSAVLAEWVVNAAPEESRPVLDEYLHPKVSLEDMDVEAIRHWAMVLSGLVLGGVFDQPKAQPQLGDSNLVLGGAFDQPKAQSQLGDCVKAFEDGSYRIRRAVRETALEMMSLERHNLHVAIDRMEHALAWIRDHGADRLPDDGRERIREILERLQNL